MKLIDMPEYLRLHQDGENVGRLAMAQLMHSGLYGRGVPDYAIDRYP